MYSSRGRKVGQRIVFTMKKWLTDVKRENTVHFGKQYFRTCSMNNTNFQNKTGPLIFQRNFRSSCDTRAFAGRGGVSRFGKSDYIVCVKTGDQLHNGTDANVYIVLHSESGEKTTPINLDYFFRNDFERGQLDTFNLNNISLLNNISKIEIWRDDAGLGSEWFLDFVEIKAVETGNKFMFPVFRWIKPHKRYIIHLMDNFLPQFDPDPVYRLEEMEQKRINYQCAMKVPGGPAQVRNIVRAYTYLSLYYHLNVLDTYIVCLICYNVWFFLPFSAKATITYVF